jgi:hypothetical protein
MAKKAGVNKAAKIREYFQAHPNAKGVEVVTALAKEGIKVAAAQVSNVKIAMGKKQKPGKKAGRPSRMEQGQSCSIEAIVLAGQLIKAAGSAKNAVAIIDVLNGNLVGNG